MEEIEFGGANCLFSGKKRNKQFGSFSDFPTGGSSFLLDRFHRPIWLAAR
jgi:hypothetical protein